ncbi:MAG: hypothetical protein EXR62_16310 [Chloroflexi bacterium]|nr:hypothetical protein [Chloroflexota bacterium]
MSEKSTLGQFLQRAVESIYEDERLRSSLNDEEAQVLLKWGEKQVANLTDPAAVAPGARGSQVAATDHLQRIRAILRDINDLVGEQTGLTDDQIRERIQSLLASQGKLSPALSQQIDALVAERQKLSGPELVARLVNLAGQTLPAADATTSSAENTAMSKKTSSSKRSTSGSSFLSCGAMAILGVVALVAVLAVGGILLLRSLPLPPDAPEQPAPETRAPVAASSWYDLYFTNPIYPDKGVGHQGSLDEKLAAFINTAYTSVDIAIYQLDLKNVTTALLDARKRGITVRAVTDIDILNDTKENPSFKQLQAAGVTVVGGNPNAIMHDKFVVVDGKAVWTGSWNFTDNDTYRYNNNGILFRSPELAKNYTVVFEKMWRDKKFGPSRKPGGTTQKLTIEGAMIESYFSPEDNVSAKIVASLKRAEKTIDFFAFSFTDDDIGDAVVARAKAGVKVRGVFEKTGSETEYSEMGKMKAAKLDVLQDGNPYLMHEKVFVIDGKTVVLGSFNFSQNAETENDENLLIMTDTYLGNSFTQEFERVYKQAKNPPNK